MNLLKTKHIDLSTPPQNNSLIYCDSGQIDYIPLDDITDLTNKPNTINAFELNKVHSNILEYQSFSFVNKDKKLVMFDTGIIDILDDGLYDKLLINQIIINSDKCEIINDILIQPTAMFIYIADINIDMSDINIEIIGFNTEKKQYELLNIHTDIDKDIMKVSFENVDSFSNFLVKPYNFDIKNIYLIGNKAGYNFPNTQYNIYIDDTDKIIISNDLTLPILLIGSFTTDNQGLILSYYPRTTVHRALSYKQIAYQGSNFRIYSDGWKQCWGNIDTTQLPITFEYNPIKLSNTVVSVSQTNISATGDWLVEGY